MSVADLTG
jgi:hypothetical protein